MGDGVCNISKGRGVEFYNHVENNVVAASGLVLVLLKLTDTDAVLLDYDDLSALIADAQVTEADFASYARIVLTETELAALPAPDDTNDRFDIDLPDQTWSAATTGQSLLKLLICYDPNTAGGADTEIIPITHHDFVATTDGNDLVAVITNFLRAA